VKDRQKRGDQESNLVSLEVAAHCGVLYLVVDLHLVEQVFPLCFTLLQNWTCGMAPSEEPLRCWRWTSLPQTQTWAAYPRPRLACGTPQRLFKVKRYRSWVNLGQGREQIPPLLVRLVVVLATNNMKSRVPGPSPTWSSKHRSWTLSLLRLLTLMVKGFNLLLKLFDIFRLEGHKLATFRA
jgi:hypothetical protein